MNTLLHKSYAETLAHYLPPAFVNQAAAWVIELNFDLKITKARNTKLGDYMSPVRGSRHKISINHNLNPYAFLVTLVHEIAHLKTYNKFGWRVSPHGDEWKNEFRQMMFPIIQSGHLPLELAKALHRYMMNPAAASCSDVNLHRTLKYFDVKSHQDLIFVEQVPIHKHFNYQGRIFLRGEKNRTRFKCIELKTKQVYLFNSVTEVKLVAQ